MASILKVDTLTGVATAGSIAVTGEGNSTTTNLQQGLAKAWCNNDQNSTHDVADSFNISSITDGGTSATNYVFTNNMSTASHAPLASGFDTVAYYAKAVLSLATTGYRVQAGGADFEGIYTTTHGDLA